MQLRFFWLYYSVRIYFQQSFMNFESELSSSTLDTPDLNRSCFCCTPRLFSAVNRSSHGCRAYRTPMMPCCRPTARGLSVAETPRVKAQPRKHRQPTLSRRALLRRLHHLQRVACQQWYTSPPAPASTGGETSKMITPFPCSSCGGGGTAISLFSNAERSRGLRSLDESGLAFAANFPAKALTDGPFLRSGTGGTAAGASRAKFCCG